MSFFNRSGPCAPIHLALPLLGSAVAFLSLISVFAVLSATHNVRHSTPVLVGGTRTVAEASTGLPTQFMF